MDEQLEQQLIDLLKQSLDPSTQPQTRRNLDQNLRVNLPTQQPLGFINSLTNISINSNYPSDVRIQTNKQKKKTQSTNWTQPIQSSFVSMLSSYYEPSQSIHTITGYGRTHSTLINNVRSSTSSSVHYSHQPNHQPLQRSSLNWLGSSPISLRTHARSPYNHSVCL
jgi:hypothetical protein